MEKVQFVPLGGFTVRQRHSLGRTHHVVGYHIKNYRRRIAVMPEGQTLRVRFVKGGLMYANRAVKSTVPAWVKKAPRYGKEVVAPMPTSMRQIVQNLTAIEESNRTKALRSSRAG